MTIRSLFLSWAFVAALVLTSPTVCAQTETGLPVVISVGSSGLDAAAVTDAIRNELGVPLRPDANARERLEVVVTGRRANVTYYRKEGDPVTRSVDLPKDGGRALETIAFLAGNLARDEAAELLADLAPEKTAEPAPEPEPAAEAPPPPPPPPAPPATTEPPKPASPEPAQDSPKQSAFIESQKLAFNISVFHPYALLPETEKRRLNLELGLLASRIGALKGLALSLGYQRVDGPTEGFSYALVWNRAGAFNGVHTATFVNEGYGALTGISYANIANVRYGDVKGIDASALFVRAYDLQGVQGSGVVSLARNVRGIQGAGAVAIADDVSPIQLAGAATVARDVNGVQLAGAGAVARDMRGISIAGAAVVARDMTGIQLAGASAVARDLRGAQLSGAFNLARDMTGLQLGVVNASRRVRGVQIGVVNVSSEMDGGAIGLVNIARDGKVEPSVWISGPDTRVNAGVRFVTGYTYAQLGAGYDPKDDLFVHEAGAGLHLGIKRAFFEMGPGIGEARDTKNRWRSRRVDARAELRVGYEVVRWVTPFAGGRAAYRLNGEGKDWHGEYFVGVSAF
jgi:hypothetical protein